MEFAFISLFVSNFELSASNFYLYTQFINAQIRRNDIEYDPCHVQGGHQRYHDTYRKRHGEPFDRAGPDRLKDPGRNQCRDIGVHDRGERP